MFPEKRWNVSGLKTLIMKVVSTGAVERLPDSGHPQQHNVHFSCRSYLIILVAEVQDVLYVMYFATVSLWLSFLAKCKTFNVLYVARCKYLSSVVNPVVAKQMYMMSELCHRYQRIFIPQLNNFYTARM